MKTICFIILYVLVLIFNFFPLNFFSLWWRRNLSLWLILNSSTWRSWNNIRLDLLNFNISGISGWFEILIKVDRTHFNLHWLSSNFLNGSFVAQVRLAWEIVIGLTDLPWVNLLRDLHRHTVFFVYKIDLIVCNLKCYGFWLTRRSANWNIIIQC